MHGKRFEKLIRENDGKCSPIQIIKYHPHVAAATIIPSHWHSPCDCPNVVASGGIEASTYNLVSEGGPLQVWSKVQPCPTSICVNLFSRVQLDLLSELSPKTWFVGSMIAAQHQSLKWAKALHFSVRFRTAATHLDWESIKLKNPGLSHSHLSVPQNGNDALLKILEKGWQWR